MTRSEKREIETNQGSMFRARPHFQRGKIYLWKEDTPLIILCCVWCRI